MQHRNGNRYQQAHRPGPARNPFANRGGPNGTHSSKRLGYTDSRYNSQGHHHHGPKGSKGCLSNPFSILMLTLAGIYFLYTVANPPMPVATLSASSPSSLLTSASPQQPSSKQSLEANKSLVNNSIVHPQQPLTAQQQPDLEQEENQHRPAAPAAAANDLKVNQAFYAEGEELDDGAITARQQEQEQDQSTKNQDDDCHFEVTTFIIVVFVIHSTYQTQ